MEYENAERFLEWYEENSSAAFFSEEDVLADVERQYMETGKPQYEMASYETKSGNPELYNYEVEEQVDKELDVWHTRIIF